MKKFILPILTLTLIGAASAQARQLEIHVPDAGSSAALLGSVFFGMGVLRRCLSKSK